MSAYKDAFLETAVMGHAAADEALRLKADLEDAEARVKALEEALSALLDACHTFTPGGRRQARLVPRLVDIKKADAALAERRDGGEKC